MVSALLSAFASYPPTMNSAPVAAGLTPHKGAIALNAPVGPSRLVLHLSVDTQPRTISAINSTGTGAPVSRENFAMHYGRPANSNFTGK